MKAKQLGEQAFIAPKTSSNYACLQQGSSQSSLLVKPHANQWDR